MSRHYGSALRRNHRTLGPVRRCARCEGWWPDDSEFFYVSNPAYCKACWNEYHREHKRKSA